MIASHWCGVGCADMTWTGRRLQLVVGVLLAYLEVVDIEKEGCEDELRQQKQE